MAADALAKARFQADYHARRDAVEAFKAQELAAMTEERAWEIATVDRRLRSAP